MRPLERVFYNYGKFVTRHPLPFLLLPVLITLGSFPGLLYFHSEDDIWDIYSPLNGISRKEAKALEPFEYASSAHHYRVRFFLLHHSSSLLSKAI
ncbi:hypothetical protein AB6A40_008825 [Gnathostoma spinigerum]|uniref:Uncharacterized protein n=1 Tax=Gnathostoma spinigerum TaxID=75299 RepID=A0ABD6EQK1_9BILA